MIDGIPAAFKQMVLDVEDICDEICKNYCKHRASMTQEEWTALVHANKEPCFYCPVNKLRGE